MSTKGTDLNRIKFKLKDCRKNDSPLTELVSRVLLRQSRLHSSVSTVRCRTALAAPRICRASSLSHMWQNLIGELLRIGFTFAPCYHECRWALTSPFHPYITKLCGLFLLHFPWSHLRRTLSVILLFEARTFLTAIPCGVMLRECTVRSEILYHN